MTLLVALGVMTGAGDRFLSAPGAPAATREARGQGAPPAAPAALRPVCPYCCNAAAAPATGGPKLTAESRLPAAPAPRPSGA